MASLDDVVSQLQNVVRNLGLVAQTFSSVFPRVTGKLTLSNATTTSVTDSRVTSPLSIIQLIPTNATAALTQRTLGLFVSAATANVGFSLSTQGGSAAGGETFSYVVVNPV